MEFVGITPPSSIPSAGPIRQIHIMKQQRKREMRTILFADVVGFSELSEFQLGLYIDEVISMVAKQLALKDFAVEQANTWGDGVVAFFLSPTAAVRCALSVRDEFRNRNWKALGLPGLQIRISIHTGEVFASENPITKKREFIGTEVNRTARIEPIVSPNQVYATKAIVELAKQDSTGLKFDSIGEVALAKHWPGEELFVCSRKDDLVDVRALIPPNRRLQRFLGVTEDSQFGRQLCVSSHAKAALGIYCAVSGFWKQDEVLFLESGTIPVYLFHALCTSPEATPRPERIVTNNVACCSILLRAKNEGPKKEIYPLDDQIALIMLSGQVWDDYSAILPEFTVLGPPSEESCLSFLAFLKAQKVNRVAMMVTKLKADLGPCAVSTPMGRFKKLLLRYVCEEPSTQLVIVAEAAKFLNSRPGKPIESIPVGDSVNVGLWDALARSGRVSIVSALSSELSPEETADAHREASEFFRRGIDVTLIDAEGRPISLSK
jgi:class 3 adenylate cyclase